MRLYFNSDNDRFETETEFSEKSVPKGARFRWDAQAKCWWTKDISRAAALIDFADESAKGRLEAALDARAESLAASHAHDADINIPAPEGLEYRPFQRAGIAYASNRPNVLIADEMGLGKTIQAIGVINADASIKRALIVVPASIKLNWNRELEKWLARPLTVGIAAGKDFPQADVVVINFEIAHKHLDTIESIDWDLLVVDECHRVKNPKAIRTAAILGGKCKISQKVVDGRSGKTVSRKVDHEFAGIQARRRVFLTGTPIPNRPVEIHPVAASLDPEQFGNYYSFVTRYCDATRGRWGMDVSGASNLDELQEKLRSSVMIRRLKADVLTELPAKERQIIELPQNGHADVIKHEQASLAATEERLAELRRAVELAQDPSADPDAYEIAAAALQEGETAAFTELSDLRHKTAVAKIPDVVAHVEDVIEGGNKVVVIAHHRDVIDALFEIFGKKAVRLFGGMNAEDKQEAVDRFQNDDSVQVFVGQIIAAGVGITLTAASHVVFAELDWVPGNLTQAEDRCHRIGQKDSVLVQHLVLSGSIDATMATRVVEKQIVIDKALDDETDGALKRSEARIGESVRKQADSIRQAQVEAKQRAEQAEKDRAESKAKAEKAAKDAGITEDATEAIHAALQHLAAVCDGAVSEDERGFNGLDTNFGKSLAASPRLSIKQAVVAKKLLAKYRNTQIPAELVERIWK
jgi:SWI/SNF-related matrix-associated actin-dependent regulator 1 of chromatin subfamily A